MMSSCLNFYTCTTRAQKCYHTGQTKPLICVSPTISKQVQAKWTEYFHPVESLIYCRYDSELSSSSDIYTNLKQYHTVSVTFLRLLNTETWFPFLCLYLHFSHKQYELLKLGIVFFLLLRGKRQYKRFHWVTVWPWTVKPWGKSKDFIWKS